MQQQMSFLNNKQQMPEMSEVLSNWLGGGKKPAKAKAVKRRWRSEGQQVKDSRLQCILTFVDNINFHLEQLFYDFKFTNYQNGYI